MAAPIEVTVDAKGMPLPPVDPNVKIPDRVQRAAADAAVLHQQAYPTAPVTAAVTPPPPPQPDPVRTDPPPQPDPGADDRAGWDAARWMQHAKSTEGRYKQARQEIATLQNTVTEIGDELVRTQARVAQPQPQPQPAVTPPPPPPVKLLTPQDVETYGEDFLDVAQRAALQAVQPRLTQLEQRNQTLERQLRKATIQSIEAVLDREVPNWPTINLSPKFKAWLRIRDIYSGRIRSELLSEAHRAADAARVLTFFKGFLAEEEATGSTEFLPNNEPSPSAMPRVPAVELTTLAAPGHRLPAQGTQPDTSANEPIWITRGQIAQFYQNVRKGVYVGREKDYHNDQAIIFECQRAGRVR